MVPTKKIDIDSKLNIINTQKNIAFLNLQRTEMKKEVDNEPKRNMNNVNQFQQLEIKNSNRPLNNISQPKIEKIDNKITQQLITYDALNLKKFTDLASQIFQIEDKKILIEYIIKLVNKKKLIRTNEIDKYLLSDIPEPLKKFESLFKLCIRQLMFSYSIHKSMLIKVDQKYQESTLKQLYSQDCKEFLLDRFINTIRRKKKILKQKQMSPIKAKITQDLKSMNSLNYLKIYKYLTSYIFPKDKKLRFHSKITNVINDYLATLKKNDQFYDFFNQFQAYYLDEKFNKKQKKKYADQKYIKRFPLHYLIQYLDKNNFNPLFQEHIKDKKDELISKLLNSQNLEKRIFL